MIRFSSARFGISRRSGLAGTVRYLRAVMPSVRRKSQPARLELGASRGSMRRRLLVAAAWPALAWLCVAQAQPKGTTGKQVRVGMLSTGRASGPQTYLKLFIETMRELGWVEGRNVIYDRAFAEGDFSRLPVLAGELVARKPDLVWAPNGPSVRAMHAKTRTIPIVFSAVLDPIGAGLVKSLARPGGNVTGVANIGPELAAKRMQILREVFPKIQRVGVLMIGTKQSARGLRAVEETVGAAVKVIPAKADSAGELDAAFSLLAQNQVEALLLLQTAQFWTERKRVLDLAAKHRLPVMGYRTPFADDGALMSYSELLSEQVYRAAHIADKILRGAKPADIPVEQPTKFELVINLKTARALGITISEKLLLRADRVIE